jgi:CheY-like chemotaxis protein
MDDQLAKARETRAGGRESRERGGTRVLLVDDDEDIRFALRALLEVEGGYTVVEASDGLAALELLRTAPDPLVVLTNHTMPHLDGPGLLAEVLEDPILAARHVYLYMTADRSITPAVAHILAELDAPVLHKPFDLDALLAAVGLAARRARPLGWYPSDDPAGAVPEAFM